MIKIKAIYLLIAVFFVFSANTVIATADESIEFVTFDDQAQPTKLKSEFISIDECETVKCIVKGDSIEFFKADDQAQPVKLRFMKSIPTDDYEFMTFADDDSAKIFRSADMTQPAVLKFTRPASIDDYEAVTFAADGSAKFLKSGDMTKPVKFQSTELTEFDIEKMNELFERKQIELIDGEIPEKVIIRFAEIAD
jgi:hypothetical protein